MNSKIVFICGKEKSDKGITDGKTIYVGDINDDYFHSTTLLNFAKENYPEVNDFANLNRNHMPTTIAYFYTSLFDHIVFLNISSTKDNEIGIHYNLELNDGMIDETSISSTRNETPRELFDKFFDREKVKMKK